MNNNESKASSLPVGKRGKPFIMTYRHHLMIRQIEFFKRELNDLLNYGTLDDTAAGSAKDIQDMIEQNIAAFVNEVHERSIWLQKKKTRNGNASFALQMQLISSPARFTIWNSSSKSRSSPPRSSAQYRFRSPRVLSTISA